MDSKKKTHSSEQLRTAAILAAGGTGSRASRAGAKPKQLIPLAGQPMLIWPLRTLAGNSQIEIVLVVVLADLIDEVTHQINHHLPPELRAKIAIIAGGDTRQASVHCGLKWLAKQATPPDIVLVHDAARPFLTDQILAVTIENVVKNGACTVAIPVSDTIKKVDSQHTVETLKRDTLYAVQTPQASRFEWLLNAHQNAATKNLAATDDATLLEHAGYSVSIVSGSRFNLKVTEQEDLVIAEALMQRVLANSV